jgi:MinD-like ATPase involved in chromosome partitioning or flagellar assembly
MLKDLLLITAQADLATALSSFGGARVLTGSELAFAQRLLTSAQPPQALYLDDTGGTVAELWAAVRAAQAQRVAVAVGLWGPGRTELDDFQAAGVAVAPMETRSDARAMAAWLAAQFGLSVRAVRGGQRMLAVCGAKGGIGKTLLTALVAESLHRRGLRVLLVDGDISNSGLVPTFRIASGFPSFLHVRSDGPAAWTPDNLRRYVYRHDRSGLSFLLGSEETADQQDLTWHEWQAMRQAIAGLDEYDVVLIDTGPEIKRRPYALDVLQQGGYALLPVHPGRKERTGAGNALQFIQAHSADVLARCLLVLMEPERGVAVTIEQVAPRFTQLFPAAQLAGRLPREPFLVSRADEEGDAYISPLDLQPWGRFSLAAHAVADQVAQLTGITPPLPLPRPSLWQRVWGGRRTRSAADVLQRPAVLS